MAKYTKGGQGVARSRLTPDEEAALAAEAERLRDDETAWDYKHPRRVRRGRSPSAVLSVRVPLIQLQALRKIAEAEGIAMSDLLKDALASYAASAGPQVSSSSPRHLRLHMPRPSGAETIQPGARQLREADPAFVRPDIDKTIAIAS